MHLCLYQPLIPQNTGNVGRLCVGLNTRLSLIKPLGFNIDDKELKRAGLDYWQHLNYKIFENFNNFTNTFDSKNIIAITKYGKNNIYDFSFQKENIILMGKETTGLPDSLVEKHNLTTIKIPMSPNIRSYNLANSSAICLSEFHRQCLHS